MRSSQRFMQPAKRTEFDMSSPTRFFPNTFGLDHFGNPRPSSAPVGESRTIWKRKAEEARRDLKEAVAYAREHGLCPNTFEPLDASPQHSETHPALVPILPEPCITMQDLTAAREAMDRQPVPLRGRSLDYMWVEEANELGRLLINQRTPPREFHIRSDQLANFWMNDPYEPAPRPPAITVTRCDGEVEDTRGQDTGGVAAVVRDGETVTAAVQRLMEKWTHYRTLAPRAPKLHITSPAWEKLKLECGPMYPASRVLPNRYMGMQVMIIPTRPGMPYMVRLV